MSVALAHDGAIALTGRCGADDAEPLLQLLLADPLAAVDWRGCEAAHTAIVQLLLAAERPVRGPPRDAFLTEWVEPLLTTG